MRMRSFEVETLRRAQRERELGTGESRESWDSRGETRAGRRVDAPAPRKEGARATRRPSHSIPRPTPQVRAGSAALPRRVGRGAPVLGRRGNRRRQRRSLA